MTLIRVSGSNPGDEFHIRNLQMITRLECSNFTAEQDKHQATVFFSDGGSVVLQLLPSRARLS